MNAATKEGAIMLLDEWGNADRVSLERLPNCIRSTGHSERGVATAGEAALPDCAVPRNRTA